jgi:hypothetical protein
MDEGINAECPMGPEEPSRKALEKRKLRTPHERAVGKDPKVFMRMSGIGVHGYP